jgi:hypothetical protein
VIVLNAGIPIVENLRMKRRKMFLLFLLALLLEIFLLDAFFIYST